MTKCNKAVPSALVGEVVTMLRYTDTCRGTEASSIGAYAGRLWQSASTTDSIKVGFKNAADAMSKHHKKTHPDYRYEPGRKSKKKLAHVKRPPNCYMLFVGVVAAILKSTADKARPPVLCDHVAVNAMCIAGPAAYLPAELPPYFATNPFEPSLEQLH